MKLYDIDIEQIINYFLVHLFLLILLSATKPPWTWGMPISHHFLFQNLKTLSHFWLSVDDNACLLLEKLKHSEKVLISHNQIHSSICTYINIPYLHQ